MTCESYSVESAAEAVGVSTRTINRALRATDAQKAGVPLLPSKWLGGKRLILADDLRAWLRSLPDA